MQTRSADHRHVPPEAGASSPGSSRGVGGREGSSFVLCTPQVGCSDHKCPVSMEIIYLAQPARHRLGTDRLHARLQARRPPKQRRGRAANAAPKRHISGLGSHQSTDVSGQRAWESGDPNQPVTGKERGLSAAASRPPGRKRRLRTSQMFTLQKSTSLK